MPKYSLLNQDINTSFLNIETTWAGMRSSLLKKQVGRPIPDSFCELVKGETLSYFQNSQQANFFAHACARRILKDKKLLSAIKRMTAKLAGETLELAEANFPVPKLSDQEIIGLLTKIRNLQMDFAAWGMVVAFADIYGEISDQVMKIFSRRQGLKYLVNFYLEVLANPIKPSLTAQAYEKIVSSKDNRRLKQKYFWLDQGYIGRGLSLKQLNDIRRHRKTDKVGRKVGRSRLLQELKLSPAEKNLLAVSGEIVNLKSLRSDTRQALYVVVNNIVDLLAARWRIPAKYLEALSTQELISTIRQSKNIAKNLADRWSRSLIIPQSADNYRIICGGGIDKFLYRRLGTGQEQIKNITELKGQVAQPGKARGRVRLVFGPQHNSKVKRGDILVSVSTSPQLLPAMKLAAAFVTEMGGITSHAAIVSRELKIPCIVGTKIATSVLKDGDLVEVDATHGIINIIKK